MPSEAALEAMAKRMDSTNFGFVVMAVNIQRTVGGSLAEILDMVADTVRQRQQFSRKVKALTAQGRMSAYVLVAMPFLMGLAIFALNPKYMSVLFIDERRQGHDRHVAGHDGDRWGHYPQDRELQGVAA